MSDPMRREVQRLRERVSLLALDGKVHSRAEAALDADLHVGAEIREQLEGAIDGSNRTFRSTKIPTRDGAIPLAVLRGLTLAESAKSFTNSGLTWWLAEAPETDDERPVAIYRCDPRLDVGDFDPALALDDELGREPRRRRPTLDDPATEWAGIGAGA